MTQAYGDTLHSESIKEPNDLIITSSNTHTQP